MPDLNINTLPPYQDRQFVPEDADFSQTQVAVELFEKLANRPLENFDAFQQWLLDRSELEAALDQHKSILYRACPQIAFLWDSDFIEHQFGVQPSEDWHEDVTFP